MNNKEKEQKEKLPFAQRHPILNSLLGLFILLLGIAIAVFVIYWLAQLVGKGVSEFINWGEEKLSKMDSVVVVALITGAVSIIGVLFTAVISKIIEYKQKRREYLNQKRETAYGQFVDVYYKLMEKTQNRVEYTDEDMLDDMSKFSRELTLWGSNNVVKKWIDFRLNASKGGINSIHLVENVLFAMRKDMGFKKMKKGTLLKMTIKDYDKHKKGDKT